MASLTTAGEIYDILSTRGYVRINYMLSIVAGLYIMCQDAQKEIAKRRNEMLRADGENDKQMVTINGGC
jgi:hypothetical protein